MAAATGLPIAAALGSYSAQNLLDGRTDMDEYFSPYRHFPIQGFAQKLLGKKLSLKFLNYLVEGAVFGLQHSTIKYCIEVFKACILFIYFSQAFLSLRA